MKDREVWLTATVIELASADAAAFDELAHLRLLVARLAELLHPTEVAALLAHADGAVTTAASAHRARDLIALESSFARGPCTHCYAYGRERRAEALVDPSEQDTPFGAAVGRLGYRTCSTLPMSHRGETIGAVCVLDATDPAPTGGQLTLARLLTEAATAGILQQRLLYHCASTSRQLQAALDSRVVIEQAKGVLAARLGATPQAGFEVLRSHARRHNQQLTEVAGRVVRGELTEHDLT